jgi:hypothetical protein
VSEDADVRGEIAALQRVVASLARKLDASHSLSRGMVGDDRIDPHKIVVVDDLRTYGWKPKPLKSKGD